MNPVSRMLFRTVGQIVDYLFLFLVSVFALIVVIFMLALITPAHSRERVVASVYGDYRDWTPNKHLRALRLRLATGGIFDPNGMAVAHKTLPFGTWLTLKHGRRSAVVIVSDRGPYIKGRTLDLTPAANRALLCGGLCRVAM